MTLDARVVLFTFALSALTALVFGLLPLAASERRDLTDLLREGGARSTSGGARQHRLQAMLVVSSVALAFVLLASAGLLMRSFDEADGAWTRASVRRGC